MVSNCCSHDEVYRDMCVLCGTDLRHLEANKRATALASATVSMIHSVPDLKVSREKAEQLGRADEQHLLNDRRLVLLVDLDQTVIHTTNSNVSPTLKDVEHFQLYGPNSPWYHTKIRPHAIKFLQNISKKYELHICTFGVRVYAHTIARILDPDKSLFGYRILSRDELLDPHSKTGNLSALFPCGDELVCIIDDREDVWNFSTNCIAVKPYLYFKNTGDINWPPQAQTRNPSNEPQASTSCQSKSTEIPTKVSNVSKKIEATVTSCQAVCSSEPSPSTSTAASSSLSACASASASSSSSSKSSVSTSECKLTSSEVSSCKDEATSSPKPSTSCESKEKEEEQVSTNESDERTKKDDSATSDAPTASVSGDTSEPCASTSTSSSSSGLCSSETEETEDTDDYLLYLEDILDRVHTKYYELYDEKLKYKSENEQIRLPDLKDVIPQVRNTTLAGCNIVFSGVIPTNAPLERSREYIVARQLGATVGRSVIVDGSPLENTTHVVAARMGSAKVNAALKASKKRKVHIVNPLWLLSCAERWERVSEQLFTLKSTDDFQGKSQLQHKLPQSKWYESSSNKLVDSIPLGVFSADDLHSMDLEVEEACSTDAEDEDDDDDEIDNRKDMTSQVERNSKSTGTSRIKSPELEDDSQDASVYQVEEDSNFSKVGESDDEDGSGRQLKDYNSESSTSTSSNECSNEDKRRRRKRKWQDTGNDNDSPSSSSLDENMAGDLVEQEFLRESM